MKRKFIEGLCSFCSKKCKVKTSGVIECSGFKPDKNVDCIITNYQTVLIK